MSISSIPFMEAWAAGDDGLQFYTRTYPATFPRAVVLFVHGFAEHIGRYETIHAKYPARGITLFAFDQRGYGRTALDAAHRSKESRHGRTSWQSQMRDIQHFAKRLAEEYMGVPLFLMGNSMVRVHALRGASSTLTAHGCLSCRAEDSYSHCSLGMDHRLIRIQRNCSRGS